MKLLLICKTPIIINIFELISKKLSFELLVQDNNSVSESFDVIIVDSDFIDDRFNIIKQFSKKLGAITPEELPFDKARDFIIRRPFLPKELYEVLLEQFDIIKKEKTKVEHKENKIKNETEHVVDYLDSLAEDIANDINDEESDESIVSLNSLKKGGILDNSELSKIRTLLISEDYKEQEGLNNEDWEDLSEIIDKAIDEVRNYEFYDDKNEDTIELVLNRFKLDELKPLLMKLDQSIIDTLSNGKSVNLELKLKANSDK